MREFVSFRVASKHRKSAHFPVLFICYHYSQRTDVKLRKFGHLVRGLFTREIWSSRRRRHLTDFSARGGGRQYITRARIHPCTARVDRCEQHCRFVCSSSDLLPAVYISCRERRYGGGRGVALHCNPVRRVSQEERPHNLRYVRACNLLHYGKPRENRIHK